MIIITEKVFDSRTNTNTLTVEEPEGTPKSWTGIDHMVLDLVDKEGVLAAVQHDPASIDFSVAGQLVFTVGGLSVPAGTYKVELAGVDAGANKSQIIHWERDKVEFEFLDTQDIT